MSDKQNKILFLSAWYPNREDPMFGLFVKRHAMAAALYEKVAVLYICHSNKMSNKSYEIEINHTTNGQLLEVIIYYKSHSNKFTKKLKPIINNFRYIKAFIKGWKLIKINFGEPNLIHVNILTRTAIIALYFKIIHNIPYIITEHWSRYLPSVNTYKGIIRQFFTKLTVKQAKALLVVSDNLRKAMANHNIINKNTFIINNVVDTNIFVPKPAEKENGISYRLIQISCFEDKSKNISGMLRALKRLTNIRQDFVLHLIGEGQDKLYIKNLAEKLDLKDKYIKFDGLMINPQTVAEAIGKSHILILFSNYENIPVVINEAFSCGKPVVATKVGGINEIVTPNCGILVEPNDEQDFALAIDKMLNNLDKYDPQNIRQKIINKYSMESVGYELYTLYKNILNNKI